MQIGHSLHPLNKLSIKSLTEMMISFAIILLLASFYLPFAIVCLSFLALIIKALQILTDYQKIPRFVLYLFVLAGLIVFYSQFKEIPPHYQALGFLLSMVSAKIIETETRRDGFILFSLNIILIATMFLFSQDLWMALCLSCVLIINFLAQFNNALPNYQMSVGKSLKEIFRLFLFVIPFVIILFFLFPRVKTPFFGLPLLKGAKTGLGEEMQAGEINNLAQSDEIAFRVIFKNKMPKQNQLYWRGPVLWHFDGMIWNQRHNIHYKIAPVFYFSTKSKIFYKMMLEPNTNNWVLSLDMPVDIPNTVFRGASNQLKTRKPINTMKVFELSSALVYRANNSDSSDLLEALQVPEFIFPKTRALALQLREENNNDEAFINTILNYFKNNRFYYRLKVPDGLADLDKFMFTDRVGYCEHYASALAFMARVGGIPARIVMGYQGGEINSLTKQLVVRQRNAHAWTELWLGEKGWVRVDPVKAIAPARIENSLGVLGAIDDMRDANFQARMMQKFASWKFLRNVWEAGNAFWQDWVVNLDSNKQDKMAEKLNLSGGKYSMIIYLFVFLFALFVFMFILFKFLQRDKSDQFTKLCKQLNRKLQRRGYFKDKNQSFHDFLLQVAEQNLNNNQELKDLAEYYEKARYAGIDANLVMFARSVHKIR